VDLQQRRSFTENARWWPQALIDGMILVLPPSLSRGPPDAGTLRFRGPPPGKIKPAHRVMPAFCVIRPAFTAKPTVLANSYASITARPFCS
jgi:hypothetical protein